LTTERVLESEEGEVEQVGVGAWNMMIILLPLTQRHLRGEEF